MDKQYPGTLLIPQEGGTPDDINKALLDMLNKVNEVSSSAASDSAVTGDTGSISAQVQALAKGLKYGLEISYISSDTLSVNVGMCEVNGATVSKASATSITASLSNFPSAGTWAYLTIESGGDIRLFPATGAATSRPTDNYYQLSGGSVGYDDIKKQGYYYDASRRIIGAIHKVNSTTFYIINNYSYTNEAGNNSRGYWDRLNRKWIINGSSPTIGLALDNTGTATVYTGTTTAYYPIVLSTLTDAGATAVMAAVGNYGSFVSYVPGLSSMDMRINSVGNGTSPSFRWFAAGY